MHGYPDVLLRPIALADNLFTQPIIARPLDKGLNLLEQVVVIDFGHHAPVVGIPAGAHPVAGSAEIPVPIRRHIPGHPLLIHLRQHLLTLGISQSKEFIVADLLIRRGAEGLRRILAPVGVQADYMVAVAQAVPFEQPLARDRYRLHRRAETRVDRYRQVPGFSWFLVHGDLAPSSVRQ